MNEIIDSICALIVGLLLCACIIFMFIMCLKYDSVKREKQREFIENLRKDNLVHYIAMITAYNHINVTFKDLFSKRKKD